MGNFEKNCMQHKCNRKLMGEKGKKKYPAHQIARKKILDDQKSPTPPPSRVKWSAPFYGMISLRVLLLILTNVL